MTNTKNICFITLGNLYLCPYLNTYLNATKHNNVTIIYWDREGKEEIRNDGKKYVAFKAHHTFTRGPFKIIGYIKFKKFLKRTLSSNKFTGIVLLQTLAALLLTHFLVKYYPHKYIIDIRDYSHENIFLVKLLEKKVFEKSYLKVISSEGFKVFLPSGNYQIVHNTRTFDNMKHTHNLSDRTFIHIAYIGYVRYIKQFKQLISKLKNDNRFILSFIGTNAIALENFCKKNNVTNVILRDTFNDKDTQKLYENVDIVNNLYGNNTPVLDYALSNKLYIAAALNKPILVCPNTYMETITIQYGLGHTVDINSSTNIGDEIFNYYNNINWNTFYKNCNDFNRKVALEQSSFIENITRFIN